MKKEGPMARKGSMTPRGKGLGREELEGLITGFLLSEPLCVLATCSEGSPRASTVEFFPSGTTIYILTEGGRKLENIRKNPRVSVAVHGPFGGWEGLRGLQITGTAETGRSGSEIFSEALSAYRRRRGSGAASIPDFMHAIRVRPARMEYLDTSLEGRGLRARHVLEFP
jgi:hypothetical protein